MRAARSKRRQGLLAYHVATRGLQMKLEALPNGPVSQRATSSFLSWPSTWQLAVPCVPIICCAVSQTLSCHEFRPLPRLPPAVVQGMGSLKGNVLRLAPRVGLAALGKAKGLKPHPHHGAEAVVYVLQVTSSGLTPALSYSSWPASRSSLPGSQGVHHSTTAPVHWDWLRCRRCSRPG